MRANTGACLVEKTALSEQFRDLREQKRRGGRRERRRRREGERRGGRGRVGRGRERRSGRYCLTHP